jgi:pSer/pThr/pTyr-binding forkhead associated (FHA) protein
LSAVGLSAKLRAMYCVLVFVRGPEEGETIAVPKGARVSIGRSSKSTRKVRDTHLSRVHLEIDYTGSRALVRDMGSRNGTYVNGRRVRERALQDYDRVLAGEQSWDVTYVHNLSDLEDEAEETMSFLDQLKPCTSCGRDITLATFADGDVPEHGGEFLCPDCAVVVNFETNEFHGFEIIRRLGAGSAGLVFLAKQVVLDRVVALKVLRRKQKISKRTEERFILEAATISRLDHPHIVKVYDASPFPKGYFIVMEYFDATDLQSLIEERGAPSVPVATSIALQMCKALHYSGEEGIVHRDVKPANILYRADTGIAKLTDFGLAKRIGISAGTRDGEGVGTPCYMPPEQVNNARNVDHRADVYSLGASMYHLLSGRYPIIANNLQEFVQGILERDPPPIERFNPRCPREICDVVRKAMAKKAPDRYQDAEQMYQALDRARLQYGIPAPPLGPS